MRVLTFIIAVIATSSAARLMSADDIEDLFRKYMKKELTKMETDQLKDILEILHRPEHGSIRSLENSSPVRMSLDCLICRSAFATVFEGINNGQTDDEITAVVIDLCTILDIESYNICHGAVSLNIPIITYIIKNTPAATPRTFCGLLLQNSGNPNFCSITDSRFVYKVDLPQQVVQHQTTRAKNYKSDTKPLKIALITDAHIDPLYEAYGAAECGEPTCCRKGQTVSDSFIFKSNFDEGTLDKSVIVTNGSIMLDLSVATKVQEMKAASQNRHSLPRIPEPAGYWGDYRNCDTPLWAFDDVINTITQTHKDIDVVYYIGDTIDHGVWETSYELINEMNDYIIDKFKTSFGHNILVVPAIGNHDSQPTNQFAPSSVTEPKLNTTWLYEALAKKWDYYLPEEAKASLKQQGDFSLLIRPGLRVISLNNNVAYKYNWWVVYDPQDSKKHLDWLVHELFKAEAAGEKVHIITHIPPGVHDLTETWTREYNRIVNRFTDTIAAEFNGHTHTDEFKIFYNDAGKPVNMAWGGGSATSYAFYNLNYKIIEVNPGNFEPSNIKNYIYNLTEANLTPHRKPHWFQLYDMKNTFELEDLSPKSMDKLVHRMVTTNKKLLDIYASFFGKLSDFLWSSCNNDCKLDHLCKTVITVLWERERCENLKSLFGSYAKGVNRVFNN